MAKSKVTSPRPKLTRIILWTLLCSAACPVLAVALDALKESDVLKGVDQATYARDRNLAGYTVQEKYTVFRRGDHSASAEMIVNTIYSRSSGKRYALVSESGSSTAKLLLHGVLERETQLTQPAEREALLITSKNYEM